MDTLQHRSGLSGSFDRQSRRSTRERLGLGRHARLFQKCLLMLGDIVLLFVGFAIAMAVNGLGFGHPTFSLVYAAIPLFLFFGILSGAYDADVLVRYDATIKSTLVSMFFMVCAILFVLFATQNTGQISRFSSTLGAILVVFAMISARTLLVLLNHRMTGLDAERTMVIEDGLAAQYGDRYERRQFDLDIDRMLDDPLALDILSSMTKGIDRVIVSCPQDRQTAWARVLRILDVRAELVSEQATALGVLSTSTVGDQCTLVVSAHPLKMRQRAVKRAFDLVVGSAMLMLALPVMVAVAIAIMIEDGRPVFFVQNRIGQGNRSFPMFKFRSMKTQQSDFQASELTKRDDVRVTRVGRFIRRTSLDELPQLVNVILGQMSIVGPRPHAALARAGDALYWEVDARYWQRHRLKPGLTGLAQVRGFRGATDHEDHLRDRLGADLEYLLHCSVWRDIVIILATVRVLIHPQAY